MQPTLTITLNADGSVAVSGPLPDRVLCYGMLEAARDAIRDFRPEEQPRIVPAGFVQPGMRRKE